MAGQFKNSIMLGVQIEQKSDVQARLNSLIKSLNENKITLDLTLKDNNIVQTLEKLNSILDVTKQKLGGDISLGNIDSVINTTIQGVEKLNGELQKSSTISDSERTKELQKQIDLSNKLVEADQKRQSKDDSANLKQLELEQTLLQKQEEAYKQIDVMKANGIISDSDITKLNQMVQKANSLKEMNNALNSIMTTSMMKESSIVTLSKQLDDAQIKLDRMKQSFGNKLPQGFVESTETEINKLREDLTKVDGMNFNGIKNSLNQVNTDMKVATNETRQLVNSLKETNGGFFSGISSFFASAGLFYGVAQAVQEVTTQIKNAYEYTAFLNQAFTDISITMSLTKEQFTDMTAKIQEMGVAYGSDSRTIMDIAKVYSNANTSVDEVMQKIKPDLWLANVSRLDGSSVTRTIQSVTNQFQLLTKEGMNAEQATEKIGNSLVVVSKNMAFDFTSGIKELTEAVATSGSVAEMANQSMDSYLSMAGAFVESTGKTGSEFGNAYKMIASRILQQGSLAEAVGTTNKEMADAEALMSKYGISIKNGNGGLKSLDSILLDISKSWSTMNDAEKQYSASTYAGVRQSSSFVAIMNSMQKQQKIYNETQTDTNALYEAQQKRAESLEGRLGTLKATYQQLLTKSMNSEQLKWMVTEMTNLLNIVSSVDGKTIAFIATIGSLVLVMSKLATLNKTLIAGEAVTGLSKFIALASGMKVVGEATTGVGTAFTFLGTSISTATTKALAFIATPLGAILTALSVTIGLVVGGFVLYQEHQVELTKQSKDLKQAIDSVNESLSHGDVKSADAQIQKAEEQQKILEDLIETKKKMEGMSEDQFYGKIGGATKADSIALVTQKIKEQTKVITDNGYSLDENTGKIKELEETEDSLANTKLSEKIKTDTKAQLENRENLEGANKEYQNFISTSQSLYDEYQNLSSQETLSAEQKTRLGEVCNDLQGKFTDLNVSVNENGVAHINNLPLVSETIKYLTDEGLTTETLTLLRENDSKACSEWSVNNQQMTYAEVMNNIENYKTEIDALGKLAEARDANASNPNFIGPIQDTNYNSQIKDATNKEKEFEAVKTRIDGIYGSIKAPINRSGGASTSGVDAQPKASKGSSAKSEAEKEAEKAEKLKDEIAKMTSKVDADPYFELNNAIKGVDNELTVNKTLLDSLKEGSPEYEKAQLDQIELDKKKQVALVNLNDEQKKQSNVLKDYLAQYGFTTDEMGNLNNSQSQIQYWQGVTNALAGSTEAEKTKKQEWIDWVKTLGDKVSEFTTLNNDKIPSVTNQWNALGNEMKKTREEMKKTNDETLKNTRDELVGYYLEQQEAKVEKLKKKAQDAEEKAKTALELEKQNTLDSYDAQIKEKQALIDSLDDDTSDNEAKLKALIKDRDNWLNDNSSYSESHVNSLNTQIKDLQKTMQKNSIQKEIDNLTKNKQSASDSYDQQLSDLEKANKEQEEANDKKWKKMTDSKKAYQKIDKMITNDNEKEMVKLYESYGTNYTDIGSLYGTNVTNAFKEKLKGMKEALEEATKDLKISAGGSGKVSSSDDEDNSSSSNGDTTVKNSNGTTTTTHSDGTKTYSNGDYTDKNGWYHTAGYDTGGRTPDNIPDSGAMAILHKNEKILNAKDTVQFDSSMLKIEELYDSFKTSGAILEQLSRYTNLGSYNMPNIIGTDLNKIVNSAITTNNNNNNNAGDTYELNLDFNINAKSSTDAKNMPQDIVKILKTEMRNLKHNNVNK